MDFIIELLLDLIFEGSIEISKNKKVPKWIRYPLIFIISLFMIVVLVGIEVLGFLIIEDNSLFGIIIIILGLILLVLAIIKFIKTKKEIV